MIVEDQFVEADYLRLMLAQAGYSVMEIARSVPKAQEIISRERPDFVLLDIFLKGRQTGIDLAKQLAVDNIPFVYLSANSNEDVLNAAKATQPYGFLVKPFREKDLLVTLEIAKYRHKHSLESKYRQEAELKKSIKNIIAESGNPEQMLPKVVTVLQQYIPFDFIAAGFDNIGQSPFHGLCFLRIGFDEYQTIGVNELIVITGKSLQELTALQSNNTQEAQATFYDDQAFKNMCRQPSLRKLFADTFQLRSHLEMPMYISNGKPFSFCLYSRISDAYNPVHVDLFERAQMQLINAIEIMLDKKDKQQQISSGGHISHSPDTGIPKGCEGIIGKSPVLLNVLDHVAQVALSDTSVLLLGESGTGKEKIADCIHNLSPRKHNPFIKVNCAALPATLIESELFGHEKGAFTGAHDKRIGKFEKANGGTILLDEIGDMPVELQVKLLRVLQEKEIERIGGRNTIKVDLRIIAATNKNLQKEVAEGRFRLDLYYRLNVFPIELPPLRERREDIPALAYHFMDYYSHKSGKKISAIADHVLKNMMAYVWPGNIRELEHSIERSVLLTKGNVIGEILLPVAIKETEVAVEKSYIKTIQENERDYILSVLKKCNGRIWGSGGAAELLNLPPSTLKSKMNKLGIKKEFTS
ncbi:sigma 54-interacting response regulator [Chitinophaga sp.]|uniref:sigma 54-interacting response regulator n=1 Tax=Chitinophaga sp. TaxID=1869181 RepID=UPI0031DB91D8